MLKRSLSCSRQQRKLTAIALGFALAFGASACAVAADATEVSVVVPGEVLFDDVAGADAAGDDAADRSAEAAAQAEREAAEAARIEQEAAEAARQAELEAEAAEALSAEALVKEADAVRLGLTQATVTRIVDGDTIVVTIGEVSERVRFIGIDTPEVGTPGAAEATAFTEDALPIGSSIWLQSEGNDRDRFDRLRRHVWLDVPTDLTDEAQRSELHLGQRLLDAGHAEVFIVGGGNQAEPAPTPEPAAPEPTAAPEAPDAHHPARFRNCTHVWEVIGRPILAHERGFHSGLDRDNDGVGCETRPR